MFDFPRIPYPLFTFEAMECLCCHFGQVKEYARIGPVIGNHSGARVLVEHCDVRIIPHFILNFCAKGEHCDRAMAGEAAEVEGRDVIQDES